MKTMKTITEPMSAAGVDTPYLCAALPMLRGPVSALQGTGLSIAESTVRPVRDRAVATTSISAPSIFADGVRRSVFWSPPV